MIETWRFFTVEILVHSAEDASMTPIKKAKDQTKIAAYLR